MKLSKSLWDSGLLLNKFWIMRLYSGPLTNNLLGVSSIFKLPARISFQILQTGTLDRAVMTSVAVSMVDHLRRITKELKQMKRTGKSVDEMVALASGWDLDSPEENSKESITLTCGNCGEDLNFPSLYLLAENTLTIDHLEFK